MSAISTAMAACSNSDAAAGPIVSSGRLLAASQSPSLAPLPSGSAPPWAPPRRRSITSCCKRGSRGSRGRRSSKRSRCLTGGRSRRSAGGIGVGVAVAAVQVQRYLHLSTKKSTDWVAVQATFSPSLGVAWQTKAAITSKRTLGRVEKFGTLPPPFPMALLEVAIRENGVGVCSFFGVTPQVRNWVVTQFTKPAEELRVLRARFEDELRKFKAAEVKVRESCGGNRQRGFGLKEKERKLRDCHCPQQKGRGPAGADACPMGGSQKAPSRQVPPAQNAYLHPAPF